MRRVDTEVFQSREKCLLDHRISNVQEFLGCERLDRFAYHIKRCITIIVLLLTQGVFCESVDCLFMKRAPDFSTNTMTDNRSVDPSHHHGP